MTAVKTGGVTRVAVTTVVKTAAKTTPVVTAVMWYKLKPMGGKQTHSTILGTINVHVASLVVWLKAT